MLGSWAARFPLVIAGLAAIAVLLSLARPAAADTLDDIKARGKLLIGVTESSPPFSFRDGSNGIVGYDVDLAAE